MGAAAMSIAMMSDARQSDSEKTGGRGVALKLGFPGRRYHATPWGHHVNEGLLEWPPSPWRVLRALIATGYAKLHWSASNFPRDAQTLIEKLASTLPRYRLPQAVGTHSRHYMPMARFDKGREQTTLVLDTWAQIDGDWLGMYWGVDLSPAEEALLETLASNLGYLGRSESWVEGELLTEVVKQEFDVLPDDPGNRPGRGWEQVDLLAPDLAHHYATWRDANLARDVAALPRENSKGKRLTQAQLTKQSSAVEAAYPADLLACLQVDTLFLQELGWSRPPGTRKVYYWRRTDALSVAPPLAPARAHHPQPAEFMLLALAAENNNLGSLPPTIRTLPQGELLHRALLSRYPAGNAPSVLSGREASGEPLRGPVAHRHAHILHLDLDGDEHLDHVLLWAPMGFDGEAQQSVRSIRHEVAKKAKRPHRVAVSAIGGREDLAQLRTGAHRQLLDRLQCIVGGVNGSTEWTSVTPFVPPRFLKSTGKNTLEGQIRAELAARNKPEPVEIEILESNRGSNSDRERARKGRHFIKRRSRTGAAPPSDCGFVVRLRFDTEVQGPLLLGYGCHFGMGCFAAEFPPARETTR